MYRVTEDDERKKIAGIDVLMFHLWLLWGKTGIQPPGTILAKCEYDPSNMIVDSREIFVAYQTVDWRSHNNYSFVVKARRVDLKPPRIGPTDSSSNRKVSPLFTTD